MKIYFILCLIFLISIVSTQTQIKKVSPFKSFLSQLPQLYENGVFYDIDGKQPTIETTHDALLLLKLYGNVAMVNKDDVVAYVSSLSNSDHGFGRRPGFASDINSVRDAILIQQYIGETSIDKLKILEFIFSLFDQETGLWANRANDVPSISSTFAALQALNLIRVHDSYTEKYQNTINRIRDVLEKNVQTENNNNFFSFSQDSSNRVLSNFYGVAIGVYTGFDFSDVNSWSKWVTLQQNEDGSFENSLSSTAYAVWTLRFLSEISNSPVNKKLNYQNLHNFISNSPIISVRSALHAHLAIALSGNWEQDFTITPQLETLQGTQIDDILVQGARIKPKIQFKYLNIAHNSLSGNVTFSFDGHILLNSPLRFEAVNEFYSAESYVDVPLQLGQATMKYVLVNNIPGIGNIVLTTVKTKITGFSVSVQPKATLDGDSRNLALDTPVPIGTTFEFVVSVTTTKDSSVLSGEFDLTFSAFDSSNVLLFKQSKDCRNNKDEIFFEYQLKDNNIPRGKLIFKFEVYSKGIVHGTHSIQYLIDVPMIATEINYISEGRKYNLGNSVTVSAKLATYPDLTNVHLLKSVDFEQNEISNKRSVLVEVRSVNGIVLLSSKGTFVNDHYEFSWSIPNTFEAIGTKYIFFIFISATGEITELANYDVLNSDLFDSPNLLAFEVYANLIMNEIIPKPLIDDYYFGNELNFEFEIIDQFTFNKISIGSLSSSTVYLVLTHKDENNIESQSSRIAASTTKSATLSIQWSITPNALPGNGSIQFIAQDAEGLNVIIYDSNNQPIKYDIFISGDITDTTITFSKTSAYLSETVFIAQTSLACKNKPLKNAQLHCIVSKSGQILFTLPVAADAQGSYVVSWTTDHSEAQQGVYNLAFYRENDYNQLIDQRESNIGTTPSIKPLFQTEIKHTVPSLQALPIRTELIALFIIGAIASFFTYHLYQLGVFKRIEKD
eukprot:TRINITY_DN138_c0_g1_i1.p1 TRINITY_DN138_c0_g1~~TRINITY_DN138_c0_g1_i1.p1  ORF type:complete len:954 (-),score=458.40 TRINITY_DN138_c0_g1_i1:264-3125(-)